MPAVLLIPVAIFGGRWIPLAVLFMLLVTASLLGVIVEYKSADRVTVFPDRITIELRGQSVEIPNQSLTYKRPTWMRFTNGGGMIVGNSTSATPNHTISRLVNSYSKLETHIVEVGSCV